MFCDSSYSVISDLNSAKISSQHLYLEMSSVPISKAYVSKRSNPVKNNPKWTVYHNQMQENSTSRLSPLESRKYSGSDCKVSVLWDSSAVRLYVETRKWWTERQQIGWTGSGINNTLSCLFIIRVLSQSQWSILWTVFYNLYIAIYTLESQMLLSQHNVM